MKKLTIFAILSLSYLLIVPISSAQGNLQFNQVLNFEQGSSYTVPQGKVLKIESISSSGGNTVCIPQSNSYLGTCGGFTGQWMSNYNAVTYLSLGNLQFNTPGASNICGSASCYSVNVTFPTFNNPIWLKAGKTVNLYNNMSPILITAIEFNIIP